MLNGSRRSALLLSSALAGLAMLGLGGAAQAADQTYQFDIPAEPLGQALTDFSRTSSQQIVFSEEVAAGRSTKGLHGRYTAAQALDTLLAGSGLHVETSASGVMMVQSKNVQAAPNEGAAINNRNIETVVVTGTNIRGVDNSTSPVIEFDRDTIRKTGYTNTQDLVRSIPQNFGGGSRGASDDGNIGPGANAGNNIESGTAVNLRGLGETSTLTLLDGRRIAPSAFGGFVDVSTIPLLALERVEIVTDGASAIYGSDAVAGVANFILRKDLDGAETDAQFGTVTDGALNEEILAQAFGRQWDGGGAMVTLQYDNRTALSGADRAFTAGAPQPTNILNPYTKYSLIFNGHQEVLPGLEVFGEAFVTREKTKDLRTIAFGPNNTYNEFVDSNADNFSGGLRYHAFDDWVVELTTGYAKQGTSYGFFAYPSPVTLGVKAGSYDDTMSSYDTTATGTLFALPGGPVKAAFGLSDRLERVLNQNTVFAVHNAIRRDVLAEYGEIYVPLVGDSNALPFVQRLTLSAAIRHDHYSDFGDTTNPKIGVLWTPSSAFDVRASWGSAFRAPSIGELLLNKGMGAAGIITFPFDNPSGAGSVPVFVTGGENPTLVPEKANTWTAGVDVHPAFLAGLKFAVDYFNVSYRNRIIQPPFDTTVLEHPNVYGSLITQFPNDAAAAAYLANFLTQPGSYFIDITGTGSTGIRYLYKTSLINAAVAHQSGFDLLGEYVFSIGEDSFDIRANLAIINEIRTQLSPTSSAIDLVNTYNNPLQLRMRDDVSWTRGNWQVNAALNYANSYTDTSSSSSPSVDAFATVDLNVHYTFEQVDGLSAGLNVTNLFDRSPPYVNGGVGLVGVHYDVGNASPLGRFISFEVRENW